MPFKKRNPYEQMLRRPMRRTGEKGFFNEDVYRKMIGPMEEHHFTDKDGYSIYEDPPESDLVGAIGRLLGLKERPEVEPWSRQKSKEWYNRGSVYPWIHLKEAEERKRKRDE